MGEHDIITSAMEKGHIDSLLENNRRLDGRSKDDFRDITIKTGFVEKAEGSALVELGKTKVIAGIKILLGKPYDDYPNKGTLIVSAELNPTASVRYRIGPPSIQTIELARVTDRLVRESECIDLEDLCLIDGKVSFSVFIDIYPIDDNGNLIDAAALAAIAALSTAKVPEAKILEDDKVELLESFRPLKMRNIPISITTHKLNGHLFLDPNAKEEASSDARLTFGYTENLINSGQKGGEGTFTKAEVLEIVEKNMEKAKEIRQILKDKLAN